MSTTKDQLEKELEELDQRRGELKRMITEANPKVMKRSKWERLPPQEQADFLTKQGGKLID